MQTEQLSPAIFTPEGQVILDKPTYTAMLRRMLGLRLTENEQGISVQKAYLSKAKTILPSSLEIDKMTDERMEQAIHHSREEFHFLNEWYDLETGRR